MIEVVPSLHRRETTGKDVLRKSGQAGAPRPLRQARSLRPVPVSRNKPTLAEAARLYRTFIGRAARKVTRVPTEHPATRGKKLAVAKLANLTYLRISRNPKIDRIDFPAGKRPKLLSHPSGRQYYFQGGDQRLGNVPPGNQNPAQPITPSQLERAGVLGPPPYPRLVVLGVVTELGYVERKGIEDFKRVQYFHKAGEENGKKPVLVYDPEHRQLHLVGGDYRTKWNGINN